MRWLAKYPRIKQGLMILVLLCLLPLAPELLILFDVMGLEAALLFLFMYSNHLIHEFANRVSFIYYRAQAQVYSTQAFVPVGTRGFSMSVVASFAMLFLTGSLALAVFTWGPALFSVI